MLRIAAGFVLSAVLLTSLAGCGGGGPPSTEDTSVTPDNRPAGFEDMMKGMGGQMAKPSTKN
jgi:predicted small lipoprotein YifL